MTVIGNSAYANPDFNLTTNTGANGTLKMANSNSTSCLGSYNWLACATYSPSGEAFSLTLATHDSWVLGDNVCWTNDNGNSTCTDHHRYDVRTVVLNEMGHVNTLDHHVNPDYSDAVVQATPRYKGQTNWKMRDLRSADEWALFNRYGLTGGEGPQ